MGFLNLIFVMCKLLFEKDAHQIKAFAFAQILHSTPFRSRMTAQRVLAQPKFPKLEFEDIFG